MALSIGVVGSGLSGLVCAWRILQRAPKGQAVSVAVFEWGRGPGGRMARKRVIIGGKELFFDHGAPYFTLSDELLHETSWRDSGRIADWNIETTEFSCKDSGLCAVEQESGDAKSAGSGSSRVGSVVHVGIPESNNALCKALAADVSASNQDAKMLYGRQVISAAWRRGSDSGEGTDGSHETTEAQAGKEWPGNWEVIAKNRFPKEGASPHETYTFDILILSDKLALLPNVYAVLKPEEPIVSALNTSLRFTAGGVEHEVKEYETSSFSSPPSSFSSSALVLLVALTLEGEMNTTSSNTGAIKDISWFPCHSILSFAVFENRKPSRITAKQGGQEILQFVVHAAPDYATERIQWNEDTGEGELSVAENTVIEEMWTAFSGTMLIDSCGVAKCDEIEILHRSLFVWDHARPTLTATVAQTNSEDRSVASTAGDPFWWSGGAASDKQKGLLGMCGDFFGIGDVNSAAISGLRLADRVLEEMQCRND